MNRPRRVPLLLLVLCVVSPAFARQREPAPGAAPSPDDEEVVRVSTALVTVPVSVRDRQGRFVPGLRREDFRIYEDGVEQEVAFFETADKPFTVALLLDVSDSARFKLAEIQEAAVAFLDQLRPADRVVVIAFNRDVSLMTEATSDRERAAAAIRRTRTGGGTSLYDAVAEAEARRLRGVGGRKAIVLFTDGVDTSSGRATYESTLRAAEELDALIYPVQYKTDEDAAGWRTGAGGGLAVQTVTAKGESLEAAYRRGGFYLRRLAGSTGGRYYQAGSLRLLSESFARIAEELRRQYSLGYYPKARPGVSRRRLKVRVAVPDVAVSARGGYVYKPEAGATQK